jgi:hypothetical protein
MRRVRRGRARRRIGRICCRDKRRRRRSEHGEWRCRCGETTS